jgi:hypothetical protein
MANLNAPGVFVIYTFTVDTPDGRCADFVRYTAAEFAAKSNADVLDDRQARVQAWRQLVAQARQNARRARRSELEADRDALARTRDDILARLAAHDYDEDPESQQNGPSRRG